MPGTASITEAPSGATQQSTDADFGAVVVGYSTLDPGRRSTLIPGSMAAYS
jgi:hypothetical protein